jgi:hypothetical protein
VGSPKVLLDPPEHVQVGEGRLDHHHVGALGDVQGDLAQGLVAVGRVHLVAGAVPEPGRALGRLPERAVQAGGVLGRVGQDRQVGEPGLGRGRAGSRPPGRPSSRWARSPSPRPRPGRRRPAGTAPGSGRWPPPAPGRGPGVAGQHPAVAVVGVLAQAQVGDQGDVVAQVGARARSARWMIPSGPRPGSPRRPWRPGSRTAAAPGCRARPARPPPCAGSPACAGHARAWRRSGPPRRSPP